VIAVGCAIGAGLFALYCLGGWCVESYRHDLSEAKYRALLEEFDGPT
jgi:hypothetical protein